MAVFKSTVWKNNLSVWTHNFWVYIVALYYRRTFIYQSKNLDSSSPQTIDNADGRKKGSWTLESTDR